MTRASTTDLAVRGLSMPTATAPMIAVLAMIGALALTGCASATTTAATTGASASGAPHSSWDVSNLPDPCRGLTAAEAKGVLGSEVSAGRRLDSWPPICQYVLGNPQTGYLYLSDDSRDTAKTDFNQHRGDSTATEAVAGIGDQAYWVPDYSTLHILNGVTHIVVAFGGTTPPADARDKAVALAHIDLPRIKPAS